MNNAFSRVLPMALAIVGASIVTMARADFFSAATTSSAGNEIAVIQKIYLSTKAGDDTNADAQLATSSQLNSSETQSVTLARRAVSVCGWLQNDNNYGLANKLALRALEKLATLTESTDSDHEERLYWESVLRGRILDQKAEAVTLLEAARKLAPDDDRVVELEFEFTTALAEFGH